MARLHFQSCGRVHAGGKCILEPGGFEIHFPSARIRPSIRKCERAFTHPCLVAAVAVYGLARVRGLFGEKTKYQLEFMSHRVHEVSDAP